MEVTNTGSRAAVAVPQLYLHFPPEAQQPAPILKGFAALGPLDNPSAPIF